MSARDLKLSMMLKLVDKMTGPAKKIGFVSKLVSKDLNGTRDALKQVQEQSRKVGHLNTLTTKLNGVSGNLSETRREVDYLRRQMQLAAGTKGASALSKSLTTAQTRMRKLLATETQLKGQTGALRKELHGAGIDTTRLGKAEKHLSTEAEKLNTRLDKQRRLYSKLQQMPHAMAARWEKIKTAGKWGLGAGAAMVGGGIAATMPMLNKTAEFEGYQSVLKVLEGSSEKAKASMAWIETFATRTPYELNEVTAAFVQLRSYGMDPTSGLMNTLGDTAAAMNKPVMDAVEAMADAVTGENERLKTFGIKARAEGDLFHYDFTDKNGKQQVLSALKDDRKGIEQVLRRIWDGKFAGAQEEKAKTWTGVVSNLSDQWSKFQRMIMNSGPFEKLKGHLVSLLDKLNAMEADGSLQKWASTIGGKMVEAIDHVSAFGKKLYGMAITVQQTVAPLAAYVGGWDNLAIAVATTKFIPILSWSGALLGKLPAMIGLVMKLGPAFTWAAAGAKALGLAIIANPVGLIIAGVVAVVAGAAYLIYKHWDKVSAFLLKSWEWLKSAFFNWTPLGLMIKHWDSITDYLAGLPARMSDAGRNIIAGLGQGIDEKMQWIKEKISGLGDMLPDWLKKKLDIHSPSRVFAGIGGHISEGVGVGIDARAQSALAAVQRLGKRLPGALPAALAMGLTATAASASPVLATPAGGSAGGQVVMHIAINIHPQPGMDAQAIGQEVARQVAKLQHQATARRRSQLIDEV